MRLSPEAQAVDQAKAATNLAAAAGPNPDLEAFGLVPIWELAYWLWRRVPKPLRDRYAI